MKILIVYHVLDKSKNNYIYKIIKVYIAIKLPDPKMVNL